MAARRAVILVVLAAMLQASYGQTVFDQFERLVPVDRACIGGVGDRTNLFDIVRRDCCSIPRVRLAGPAKGVDPCPLVESDIINGVPGMSVFRPIILEDAEDFSSSAEAAAADTSSQSSGPYTFRVSNARVWENRQGERCFCPIVVFEEDDSKRKKSYGG